MMADDDYSLENTVMVKGNFSIYMERLRGRRNP